MRAFAPDSCHCYLFCRSSLLLDRAGLGSESNFLRSASSDTETHLYQLTYEEAFYMVHDLQCLSLFRSSRVLTEEQVLDTLLSMSNQFVKNYVTLRYLRYALLRRIPCDLAESLPRLYELSWLFTGKKTGFCVPAQNLVAILFCTVATLDYVTQSMYSFCLILCAF